MCATLLGFIATICAGAGWTCDQATGANEFAVAIGVIIFLYSGAQIWFEGTETVMINNAVPMVMDLILFILGFVAAYVSITDEEAKNCGYEVIKAAACMIFVVMILIGMNLLYSINDFFEDKQPAKKPEVSRSMRTASAEVSKSTHLAPPANPAAAPLSSRKDSTEGLPEGWTKHTTGEGYEYYFHAETGKSTWNKPS